MTSHLLSLAALHAAAPGVLDVVFGPDGDFEGAPRWTCHVWGTVAGSDPEFFGVQSLHVDSEGPKVCAANIDRRFSPYMRDAALDLRIPSVAARLAGLCWRAGGFTRRHLEDGVAEACMLEEALWSMVAPWGWTEQQAARLAALTLALGPRIAALQRTA